MTNNIKHSLYESFISAARLRTLPLAIAVIGLGNFLHLSHPDFRPAVFLLSMVTTVFLQVLSNFANDLGDSQHGADHSARQGPARMVQLGEISREAMRNAVLVMVFLSLFSGIFLLQISFRGNWWQAVPLFVAGLIAIAGAWFYTNGRKPYGYLALGDIAVFLFFGLLAVLGSAWLQVQVFQSAFLFPAASAGFWSMAVMNLNNIRDIASDKAAGKTTIPILIGHRKARYYQLILVAGGAVFLIVFGMLEKNPAVAGALPGFLLMVKTLPVLFTHEEPVHIDRLLKPQALGTFLAVAGMFLIAWLF